MMDSTIDSCSNEQPVIKFSIIAHDQKEVAVSADFIKLSTFLTNILKTYTELAKGFYFVIFTNLLDFN